MAVGHDLLVKGVMIDKLLATGVIIESKSALCRDDAEAWKKSDMARRSGGRYLGVCQWNNRPKVDDLESNVIFHIDDFETVAEIVGAFRRRRLSPEQRARSTQALRRAREVQRTSRMARQRPTLLENPCLQENS